MFIKHIYLRFTLFHSTFVLRLPINSSLAFKFNDFASCNFITTQTLNTFKRELNVVSFFLFFFFFSLFLDNKFFFTDSGNLINGFWFTGNILLQYFNDTFLLCYFYIGLHDKFPKFLNGEYYYYHTRMQIDKLFYMLLFFFHEEFLSCLFFFSY